LVAAAAAAVKNPTRNPGAAVVEAFAVGAGIIRRTGAPTSRRIAPHYLIQHRRVVVVVDVVLKKTTNTALAVKESSRINVDDMQTTTTTDSSPETTQPPSFDPLGLSSSSSSSLKNGETIITSGEAWSSSSSSSSSLEHQKVDGTEKDGVVKKQEMGLWAARGILLLVAAIWGTNFAVRTFFFCVRACLIRFCVHTYIM
jgi:hypothetical protein